MAVKPDAEKMYPDIDNNAVVHHPVFGVGKVQLRTGVGEKSKVVVKFKEEGEKKLAIRYANLTVDKVEEEEGAEGAAAELDEDKKDKEEEKEKE